MSKLTAKRQSKLMNEAHQLTRRILQRGDHYHATLGLCMAYKWKELNEPKKPRSVKGFIKKLFS